MFRKVIMTLCLIACVLGVSIAAAQPSTTISLPTALSDSDIRALQQQQKLLQPGADPEDAFGASIDVEGDIAVIGAPFVDSNTAPNRGSAWVFERDGDQWNFSANLFVDNTSLLGIDVSIDQGRILVGAPGTDLFEGSAHIFEKDNGGVWRNQVLFAPGSDGEERDLFGTSVAISGDFALIGAPGDDGNDSNTTSNDGVREQGAAYVFTRLFNGDWQRVAILRADDGAQSDNFGEEVALDGTKALIASTGFDFFSGKVYFFAPNASQVWTQQQELFADVGFYGDSMSIDGNTAVIGATGGSGAAYVYNLFGSWVLQTTMTEQDNTAGIRFGTAVSLSGDMLVVGASLDDSLAANSGAAYIFQRNANLNWEFDQELLADDGTAGDQFGINVAVHADKVFVGSTQKDEERGAVYFFGEVTAATPTPTSTQTPNATAQSTETPNATPQPTNTPGGPTSTPQPTVDAAVNLLLNGGFEADADVNNQPDDWTLNNGTGDKQKCNKPEKTVAFEGNCAFQFKSAAGEGSKLKQNVDLAVNPVVAGDSLTFNGVVNAKGTVNAKASVKVKYASDTTPASKLTVALSAPTTGYQAFGTFSSSLTLTAADEVTSVKVQLKNQGTTGKVLFDAVTVQKNQSVALFPLP